MTDRKHGIFEISMETQKLVDLLKSAGDFVSYDELTKACGRDVRDEGMGNLHSARRVVMREYQHVWDTVRGEGLKRLKGEAVVAAGKHSLQRIHREAKRGAEKIACVEYDKLPRDAQVSHNATAAMLGALFSLSGNRSVAKLEQKSADATQRLSLDETLKAVTG
jgi:hypothetical protein